MLKVCILTSVHPPFDTRVFHREAKSLVQAGFKVTLIAPYEKPKDLKNKIKIVGLPKYKSRILRPLNHLRIIALALKEKADIYHFHDPELMGVGIILKCLTRKPVIYDVHESYPDMILIKPWISQKLRRIVSELVRFSEMVTARIIKNIITADPETKRFFGQYTQNTRVIYNFAELEFFPKIERKEVKPPITLIHVGAMLEERGIWVMLKAIAVLKDYPITLILVGKMQRRGLEREIKKFIKNHKLQDKIKLIGQVPFTKVPEYLRRADIGLVALQDVVKFRKNICTKIFEYMASGLPIVASDVASARPFIEELKNGILFRADDPHDLARAIKELISSPEEMIKMGRKGRELFEERYNWGSEQRKLINYYKSLT